jgi:hypothetical protein
VCARRVLEVWIPSSRYFLERAERLRIRSRHASRRALGEGVETRRGSGGGMGMIGEVAERRRSYTLKNG